MKQEKSTLNVLFFLKLDKAKKNGLVPIHARITIDGKLTQFYTKLDIEEKKWKSGRPIGKSAEANGVNSTLNEIRARIHTLYHEMQQRDGYVTAERVKNAFLGKGEKTIITFFEEHNQQFNLKVGNNISTHKTYTRYELTKSRLIEFMKDKYKVSDMPIREMNPVFIENFYLHIRSNFDCSHNTAMKFIQRFRTIVIYAKNSGLITIDPFLNYKLKYDRVEREYLNQDEIDKIYTKRFVSQRLEQVRDMFIFSCYTGLSYIDLCGLMPENIRTMFDGNLWIVMKRHKTDVTSNIRLLDIPKSILKKYEGKLPNGNLLPVISNQKMNEYLKEITTVCGINKNITFHIARHTFATLSLGYGVPIEAVSKMLGHTDIKTTQIYAKITDRKLSDDMEIIARKVNGRKIANNQILNCEIADCSEHDF